MACPFLEEKVYTTTKGRMVKHYCKARGLMDVLNKEAWKNICLKDGFCIIRKQTEERVHTGLGVSEVFINEKKREKQLRIVYICVNCGRRSEQKRKNCPRCGGSMIPHSVVE